MKISAHSLDTRDIRLEQSLTTAVGRLADRGSLRLELTTTDGLRGRGEAAPVPGRPGGPNTDVLATQLGGWATSAVGVEVDELLGDLDNAELMSEARFAAHTALVELAAADRGLPVHQYLRVGSPAVVHTNALIADEAPGDVHAAARSHVRAGFPAVKLKVGGRDLATDATRIIAASEACGPDVELRLDANGGWTVEEVIHVIARVGHHRITHLEDPTDDVHEFGRIGRETGVAVAVDAPPGSGPHLLDLLERSGAQVLVAKPAAVGGIDRIVDAARAMVGEHRLIVSSAIDGPVGLLAGLHAAAALPPPARAHGLATAPFVRGMPDRLQPRSGRVELTDEPGLGLGGL